MRILLQHYPCQIIILWRIIKSFDDLSILASHRPPRHMHLHFHLDFVLARVVPLNALCLFSLQIAQIDSFEADLIHIIGTSALETLILKIMCR